MARLGRSQRGRRAWWLVGALAALATFASFGTPKAGCAGSAEDEPEVAAAGDASVLAALAPSSEEETPRPPDEAADAGGDKVADALHGTERVPPARDGYLPQRLSAIRASTFCPTAGQVKAVGAEELRVSVSGMRGVVAGDASRSVEVAFLFGCPSKDAVPLANGELRQQIGLKLRAQDTCNVVYVMWHLAPAPGIAVSVKANPGQSTHSQCADRGYINLRSTAAVRLPAVHVGEPHTLRADLDGRLLRVHADGAAVWEGPLPDEAFAFDGPVGIRSDNGEFDFELRVPGGGDRGATCVNAGTEAAR